MPLAAADRLSRARIVLEHDGLAPDGLLASPIMESWRRCLAQGLDPKRPPPLAIVEAHHLHHARECAARLRRLALGEMQNLYHQIAGTNFMIAFADPDGMLLDTICDSTFGDTARATSIRPGTLWNEAQCGTNALGTTASTGQTMTVHGGEHFFSRYGDLTCNAVPLFGPDGKLAGVLDASSDCRSRQHHTQALVLMAATQIENGLFRECHRGDIVIAFHSRGEYLHTLSVGLLAVDSDGLVLAVNGRAGVLLQGLPASPGRRFAELFRTKLEVLLEGDDSHERRRLEDRVGSTFAARLENFPRARPVSLAGAVAGAVAGTVAVAAVPILAAAHANPAFTTAFVAQDAAVAAMVRQVEAAAARRLPILIRGDTGTGKEQLARHAHQASRRRGAFVAVNCAGLPDSLVEAELFGHADGAFTGARRGGSPGLVAESDGGTLFLDEIGDMKRTLQAVLLRLLDDWSVRPVGGGRRREVDVLLVCATNVDLAAAVAAGSFRADLLYRINTVDVTLPRLHERTDFSAIARHLLAELAPHASLTAEAAALLAAQAWPGNARELRSTLARLTLPDPSRTIDADLVRAVMPAGTAAALATPGMAAVDPRSLRAVLNERVRILHRDLKGNVAETARQLRVSRNTVYRALADR